MTSIRLNIVLAGFLCIGLILVWRVFDLHISERDFLQKQGDARTVRVEKIGAHRGMIRDRRGKPLAISSPVGSLWVNPQLLGDGAEQIGLLSDFLSVEPQLIRDKLNKNKSRNFAYLKRHLPPDSLEKLLELKMPGVFVEREFHRFYPAGEVTAHVLGLTDIDDEGQEGIELAYNDWLKGASGSKEVLKNLYGQVVKDIRPLVEARPGRSLSLSLDLRVQYHAYRELKTAVQRYEAESGSVVILDVITGEVLAMVNYPSFNPNNRTTINLNHVRNRSVTDVFEPGSTVKPFTVAAALQSGKINTKSKIDTSPGFIRVGNNTIRDPSNRGVMEVEEIIAYSSQVGITKLALNLEEHEVRNMFSRIGFGRSTGSGFPGESTGELPNYRSWTDIDRAALAFGYGLMVTPLQLAGAYLTIASGGVKRPATFLKSTGPAKSERVMDAVVASDLLKMLRKVVTQGTGSRASVSSYTVAGKTGTVRKVNEAGYQDTHHLAFFAGITPAENPRLVAVVLINDPQSKEFGGGTVAAPVFSRVISGALRLLNVPPNNMGGAV
jgi:cell division protein FtsI (penicillin-binding protein 3)